MEYEYEYESDGSFEEYRDWWLDTEQRKELSDEEIIDRMADDVLYHEESFELFMNDLQSLLDRMDAAGDLYFLTGENIGWRAMSGEGFERITNPRDLVERVTPNGSYRIQYDFDADEQTLHMKVSHHDSPSGSVFRLMPVSSAVEQAYESGGRDAALEVWYDE